jgi:hypothetical protein
MRIRHLMALGVVAGAFGAADWKQAEARPVSRPGSLVQLLLSRESRSIKTALLLIARQDNAEARITQLEGLPPSRRVLTQLRSLQRSAVQLQGQINTTGILLAGLNSSTLAAVAALPPNTPNLGLFSAQANANQTIIAAIRARPPFGIQPVTATS